MTVGNLIAILEGYDEDKEIVFKPVNSDYVESFGYDISERNIRPFWGENREAYIIEASEQIGMV